MSGMRTPDAVTLEIFRHLFTALAEEMGAALKRAAFSPNIKERRDYSCALFNPAGTAVSLGDHMPVHLGVAGPAKITTLVKYAAMCGVGNSLDFFKKRTRSLATLATSHSPEGVVGPIEKHWQDNPQTAIRQVHVFPFGGIKKSAEWLEERGTWDIKTSLYPSMNSKS